MMFLKLTDVDGEQCLVNTHHIITIVVVDGVCNVYMHGENRPLCVKETITTIDKWIKDHETRTRT